jgi:hypothetical protein
MKSGSFFDGRYGQTNFHSNPTKNAPKCIIFIFKIQKFFSGEGDTPSPHPTPLGAFGASILAPSVLDGTPPEKILGTGLGVCGQVCIDTDDLPIKRKLIKER